MAKRVASQAAQALLVAMLGNVLQNFTRPGFTAQFAIVHDLAPVRVDVLQNMPGVGNDKAACGR